MSKIKLVVFDLSGTTVEDDNAVAKSLHQASVEHGLSVPLEDFEKSIGTNKIHMYQYLIARSRGRELDFADLEKQQNHEFHEEAMQLFDRYAVIMLNYYNKQVQAMPGAEETFQWCKANGIKVATDTGFHRAVNEAILGGLKWRERGLVDLSVDIDNCNGVGRPAPYLIFHIMQQLGIQSVHEVIKIGDTPADLLSGYHAGCIGNIGVLSGANDLATLNQYKHTHILPSVRELPELIMQEFA